jgi:hypothetical protein
MFTDVSEVLAALMMKAAGTSQTSLNEYKAARYSNSEDSPLERIT